MVRKELQELQNTCTEQKVGILLTLGIVALSHSVSCQPILCFISLRPETDLCLCHILLKVQKFSKDSRNTRYQLLLKEWTFMIGELHLEGQGLVTDPSPPHNKSEKKVSAASFFLINSIASYKLFIKL